MSLRFLPLLAVLAAAGCTPVAPSIGGVPLGSEFTLKAGEAAQVQGTDLRVTFLGVVSDSRCPADAICVQAGDAVLALRVGTAEVELRSHTLPERAVGIYRVRLERLEPYPFTGTTIAQSDYRAALVVTRP